MSLKLYYHPQSRAVSVDWMLRELGVSYEQIAVDWTTGDLEQPEFRALNPMGKIPTLVDDDIVVTESAAICAYLADKHIDQGLAPQPGSPARGTYYRYLFFPGTTLEPLLSVHALGLQDWDGVSMGFGDLDRGMAAVEAMTPESDWALGADFTTADIVFGGTLSFFAGFGMLSPTERVKAYVDRIEARPAFQESHAAPS